MPVVLKKKNSPHLSTRRFFWWRCTPIARVSSLFHLQVAPQPSPPHTTPPRPPAISLALSEKIVICFFPPCLHFIRPNNKYFVSSSPLVTPWLILSSISCLFFLTKISLIYADITSFLVRGTFQTCCFWSDQSKRCENKLIKVKQLPQWVCGATFREEDWSSHSDFINRKHCAPSCLLTRYRPTQTFI